MTDQFTIISLGGCVYPTKVGTSLPNPTKNKEDVMFNNLMNSRKFSPCPENILVVSTDINCHIPIIGNIYLTYYNLPSLIQTILGPDSS